ncbi:MAG: PD-(D/E)XK nuclease family protein [Candidatus Moranbacteria bacterium]|nr:PD-(D/E)XK nuclease family protein [Candidatus Moranbacteria bacterium]
MNTSYSSLNSFQTCPLRYKFSAIDKIKPGKKSPEAVFGSIIHSTMQFIHTGSFILPTQKEALNHFSQKWNPDVFTNEFQERAAFAQGIKIVQSYYKNNDPHDIKIVDIESRFSVDLKHNGEIHLISGIIDRIDKVEDGYEIIDYKTARKLPAQSHVDDNLQLLIYLLAFLKRYPQLAKTPEKIKLSLYFLKHDTKLSTTKTLSQLKDETEKILNLLDEIKDSSFEPQTSPLCDWCDYQEICPMWKHKFKEEISVTDAEKNTIIQKYLDLQTEAKEIRIEIGQLQKSLLGIMEGEEVDRLFSGDKIVSKIHRQTFKYNERKLKEILERKKLWDQVNKVNLVQLNKVLKVLPSQDRRAVEKLKKLKSESYGLSVKQGSK